MTVERVEIAYGKGFVPVDIPSENLLKVLRVKPWAALARPRVEIERALAFPIGSPSLSSLASGRRNAVIVISDITRPVPNSTLLPPILETLETSGIPRERILILIGTGMHRSNLGPELVELVGPAIAGKYRVENHEGLNLESHVDLGVSEEGVPLLVDRRYMEADLKIVTGLIEPHLMAGYSGGRKGVLPGVCSLETMKVMHGYRMIQHERTTVGRLDDNPFHLAALKLARRVGVDFLVNVTVNEQREITGVFAGDLDRAHRAGVAALEEYVVDRLDKPADIVVTSGGGYPLDQTFYQCLKGVIATKEILKPGGTIVFAAHLGEGLGSASFQDLMGRLTTPEAFLEEIAGPDYLQVDQWMVQDHCNMLLLAGEILIYTENLSANWLRSVLVHPIPSLNAGLKRAFEAHGPRARVAVLPHGPYVIAKLSDAVPA
ncbi:MAG: Lactate racemase [bacterium]|nr:Lactate racemase [bacterium]